MKKILSLLIIVTFFSCQGNKEAKTKIKKFSDTEAGIKKYREDSQKYWDKNDRENAMKYDDSIDVLVKNSFLENYKFTAVDSSVFDMSKTKKPLFLQVTASWCAPCKAEIPALNKVVKKYKDKVDFVLLFWDSQKDLKRLAPEYNPNIVLVPSDKKSDEPTTIEISGFRHITGFPTNYLVSTNNEIINYTSGAVVPGTYKNPETDEDVTVTEEDANKINFERLENEIIQLLTNAKSL